MERSMDLHVGGSKLECDYCAPFRLMAFDGGGVHGISYLPVIDELEGHLRASIASSRQFQLLVGTSTGAIIATAIKLGIPAGNQTHSPGHSNDNSTNRTILEMYLEAVSTVFRKTWFWNWPFFLYSSNPLRDQLARSFNLRTVRQNITWRQLAEESPYPQVELVVTLWDVTRERTAFLSTNLCRPGQAEVLWDAKLADIITACCSAPVYFPPRWFRKASADYLFCDGGITGLNSPATFGVSLIHKSLAVTVPVHVISFGAGETAESDNPPTIQQFRNRSILKLAPAAITALMNSTSRLMDQFYDKFGGTLNIARYLRTNQIRSLDSKLDDAGIAQSLAKQFENGEIYYNIWRNNNPPSMGVKHPKGKHDSWREMWKTEFGLIPAAQIPAAQIPVVKVSKETISGEVLPTWTAILTAPIAVVAALMIFCGFFLFMAATYLVSKERDQKERERHVAKQEAVIESELRRLAEDETLKVESDRKIIALENQRRIINEYELRGVATMNRGNWLEALPSLSAALTSELKVSPQDEVRVNIHRLRLAGIFAAAPILVNQTLLTSPPTVSRFMPEGDRVFVADEDNNAFFLDLNSNDLSKFALQVPSPHRSVSNSNRELLSPNSLQVLGRANFDESLQLWRVDSVTSEFTMDIEDIDFASISQDGRYVAAVQQSEYVWLWDVKDPTRKLGPVKMPRDVSTMQFSRNEECLLVFGGSVLDIPLTRVHEKPKDISDFAQVWNLKSFKESAVFPGIHAAVLSPDGRFLAIGRAGGGVNLINVETESTVLQMTGAGGSLRQLLFSPNGEWLVGVFDNGFPGTGRIVKWQVAPGNAALDPGQPIGVGINRDIAIEFARLSPDGTMLLVVCSALNNQYDIQVFDLSNDKAIAPPIPSNGRIVAAEFSPEGRRVLVASEEGDGTGLIKVWDLASPFQVAPVIDTPAQPQIPESLRTGKVKAWSRDGVRVASLMTDAEKHRLVVCDVVTGKVITQVTATDSGTTLSEVKFSNTDRFLAVEFLLKKGQTVLPIVFVYDLEATTDPILNCKLTSLYSTAFNSIDSHLVAADSEGVMLYDLTNSPASPEVRELSIREPWSDARFSPSGKLLAVWEGQNVQVYLVASGELVTRGWQCPKSIDDVAFSNDDRSLLIVAGARVIRWKLTDPKPLDRVLEHAETVRNVLFSPDNHWIATTTQSHVRVWDATTGNHMSRLIDNHFGSVRFTDGGLLLNGNEPFLSTRFAPTGDVAIPDYSVLQSIRNAPRLSVNGRFLEPEPPPSEIPTPVPSPHTQVNLNPNEISDYDLKFRLPLLSGRMIDTTGDIAPTTPEQAQELFNDLRRLHGDSSQSSEASQIVWHERLSDKNWNLAHIGGAFAALPHLEALAKLQPENAKRYVQLGICQENLHDWKGCAQSLQRAIELGVDDVDVRSSLAAAQIELGLWQSAEESIASVFARRAKPSDFEWLRRLKSSRRKEWQEVIDNVDSIPEEILNSDAMAIFDRGSAFAELGEFQKAYRDFKAALDLEPTDLAYMETYAHAALAVSDDEAYSEICRLLLKRYENQSTDQWLLLSPGELSKVAWTCSLAGHNESHSQILHMLAMVAVTSAKDDIDARLCLVQVRLRRKESAQNAELIPQKLIEQFKPHQEAYFALFNALARIGQGKTLETDEFKRLQELVDHAIKQESTSWLRRSHLRQLLSERALPPIQ